MNRQDREDAITEQTVILAPIVAFVVGLAVWLLEPEHQPIDEEEPLEPLVVREIADA